MKKPTLKEIADHMNNTEEAILFYNYYESIHWKVGRNKMKSWKHAVSGWLTRNKKRQSNIEKAVSNTNTAVIDRLWVRMTQIYGSKWTSNYGTEPTKPWIDTFNSMSTGKIKAGLNVLMKSGEAWPPSLIEFIGYCQCYKERLTPLPAPLRKEILAQRQATRQARESAMNKIRNMI